MGLEAIMHEVCQDPKGSPNVSVGAKAGMLVGGPSPEEYVYDLYGALWL
jgi:hypothetical protein